MLQTLFVGALIGISFLFLVWQFVIVSKILHDVTQIMNAIKLLNVKLNKLEQIGLVTMGAAENFVDALRESNGDMDQLSEMANSDPSVSFDDLRESFENGIKKLEEDSDDEEGEGWKKKS